MTDAIAKGALLGKSRELRQEKIRGHDGDKKHQNAMKEWLRWREENGDGEMPNLVPGSAKGTVPKGIVNLLKVVVNFQIFNGLGLVFGHFQTNQLSVGFLSKTEPIKFILKSQEPVAALVIPHTARLFGGSWLRGLGQLKCIHITAGHATFGRFSGFLGDFGPLRARTHENYSPWQGQAAAVLTPR
jgi:hypothetical protein